MKVEDSDGREIRTLDEWGRQYETPSQRRHWKEHRSARSVADFVLSYDGVAHLTSRLEACIGEPVVISRVVPEYEQRFDRFGRGRVHDLGMFGTTADNRSVFVGVEAKVDESFGSPVLQSYLRSKAKQITGISTNAPERIEQLLAMHFSEADPSMFDVRYQLLYATAGTLAAGADISALYVAVFRTPLYDESTGARNYRDYVHFINKVGGMPLPTDFPGVHAHRLSLKGQEVLCLHELIELPRGVSTVFSE